MRDRGLMTGGLLALALLAGPAAHGQVTFDWATVGNAGNAANTTGFGAVGYDYRMATTEVTNAQYTAFLNAVDLTGANSLSLYNSQMAGNFGGIENTGAADGARYVAQSGRENNPVAHVSWYDSLRFTNWLHNGQGSGDTETGAYTLEGGTATPSNGPSIFRNPDADYFLPSEDEWYKAAYHDASAGTAGDYFLYATGSNTAPAIASPTADLSAANYGAPVIPFFTNPFTDVGAYTDAASPYGTFDQNGNVWEWSEGFLNAGNPNPRLLRGGSWGNSLGNLASSGPSSRSGNFVDTEDIVTGFRVASSVPEPGSLALLAVTAPLLLRRRRG